jgi:hypothetical protein
VTIPRFAKKIFACLQLAKLARQKNGGLSQPNLTVSMFFGVLCFGHSQHPALLLRKEVRRTNVRSINFYFGNITILSINLSNFLNCCINQKQYQNGRYETRDQYRYYGQEEGS